jgi:formylmethanofuran dehydrogenase subunit C
MRGGKIIVHGNVGTDVAAFMKGGVIKIQGDSGPFLGFRMCDGAVHVEKNVGNRVGACMTGGKIVVSGMLEEVLPSFTIDSVKAKVKIEEGDSAAGPFYVFLGDLAENGRGKLFISKSNNPHLNQYERFL